MTYDLSKYTLLPGFIDTHVHIGWHFGKDGRFDNTGETPDDRLKAAIENARVTVKSGFTTVQSVGERQGPRRPRRARRRTTCRARAS